MQHARSLLSAGLVLFVGLALPLHAQHGSHGGNPGKDEKGQPSGASIPKTPHESGAHRRDAAPTAGAQTRQPRAERHPARHEKSAGPNQQAHEWQRSKGWQEGDGWKGSKDWKGSKAQHWDNDHRDWNQRGGYGGRHIPPDRFGRHFGPDHFFRLRGRPMMYGGYPRFYYGGYSFLIVDPWPEYWVDDWYAADDVYVVYHDGYYLYNRRYPSSGVAISVTF